jgi:hypothetical protein
MAETVMIAGENGVAMPHDLPLPSGIADRLARGELTMIEPEPEKKTAPARKAPSKSEDK